LVKKATNKEKNSEESEKHSIMMQTDERNQYFFIPVIEKKAYGGSLPANGKKGMHPGGSFRITVRKNVSRRYRHQE